MHIKNDIAKARVFYFSFYRPYRPNFLKIEKKIIKEIFFNFLFLFFPPTHASTVLEFNSFFFCFVFSTAARLILLKIKFIRTIFQLN